MIPTPPFIIIYPYILPFLHHPTTSMASSVLIPRRLQVIRIEALHVVLRGVLCWQLDVKAVVVVGGEVHLTENHAIWLVDLVV